MCFFIDCVSVYEGTEEHHGVICIRTITGIECLGASKDVSNFSTLGGWATTHLLQRHVVVSPLHRNNITARGFLWGEAPLCLCVTAGAGTILWERDCVHPDIKLLWPFHLPSEFGNIVICSAYVPPSGNVARAAARIADCVHNQLQCTQGSRVFILGDHNHCKLELSPPEFEQYVKCGTRDNRVLDKCYGNIRNAYSARPKPPLWKSDHNTLHLIPTYNTVLMSSKPLTKTVTVWS